MTASRKQRNNKTRAKPASGRGANMPAPKIKRDSLKKLRAHIDTIEERLSHAQGLTRISIKALDSSFENLNKINQGSASAHTVRLAEHVDALSAQLTEMIAQTRKDVAHDLKIVLADPRLETINEAIAKANQRLSQGEAQNIKTIDNINSQIADFATQLETETGIRQKEFSGLGDRLDALETQSTEAMTRIGDKVVDVSENLTQNAENLRRELGEKSLSLTQDFEEHKSDLAMRIEAIEDDQRNTIPSIERRLVTLDERLDILENAKTLPPMSSEPESEITSSAPPYDAAPHVEPDAVKPEKQALVNPPRPEQTDAFSPSQAVRLQAVTPPENPYQLQSSEQGQSANMATAEPGPFVPQEFNPQEYIQEAPVTTKAPLNTETPATAELAQALNPTTSPAHAPFNLGTGAFEQLQDPDIAPPPFAHDTAVPNTQPLEQSMVESRPGADLSAPKTKSPKWFKKPSVKKNLKPQGTGLPMPIKTTALMVSVAALGLFAVKTVLPKFIGDTNDVQPQANLPQTPTTEAPQERPVQTVEAIGDYSDTMKAPDLGQAKDGKPSPQALTLEAAAAKGEAIAQFQLGLSHLEAGRNSQAVRLIRLAANQKQPAAQYRLGKLYEAGVGVKANPQTAMGLLEQAASGGNRIAMHDLGHYYATGITGKADIKRAMNWFREAASRGVLDSQFNLGVLYQGGNGIDKNMSDAYFWYAIAGGQGDKVAAQRSQIVAKELSQEQLTQARARLKAFAPKPINDAANGVFKNLPWLAKAKPTANHIADNNKIGVKTAQSLLSSLGYDVGTPDGAMGPRTRNAVISFERANGLPETGRINAALLDRLNLAAGV